MSKTVSRIYARGYRAGRRLTRWEKLLFLLRNRRSDVEEWVSDKDTHDTDFIVLLFSLGCLVTAVLMVWAGSR